MEAKYLGLAEELESKIDSRTWKHRLPGVATLSREFGVNTRTVSRALKVLSQKGKIEIRPSSGAYVHPRRQGRRYGAIAVLGLLHSNKTTAELVAIEEQAKAKNYHVINVEHSCEIFKSKPDILLDLPVDGFIFTNSIVTNDIANDLKRRGIPFISINRISDVEGINWVDFHHENAHTEMLNHLLSLGHRRIAYVSFQVGRTEHVRRTRELYQNVLLPKGGYDPALHVDDGDTSYYFGRYGDRYAKVYGTEKASMLMRRNSRPTAVICAGRDIARGVMHRAKKLGLSVPGDLSVVATGQNRRKAEQEKFLTMITGSICHKAQRATELLMQLIDSPERAPVQEFIELQIIHRCSTGPCTSQ